MGDFASNLLIAKRWLRHATTESSITSGTTFDSDDAATPAIRARFVSIVAVDGDLLVELGSVANAAGTPGTGSMRVFEGTMATFQTLGRGPDDPAQVKLVAVTGTVAAAVIWGM